ncbi:serine/threonine-protein kinase [Streptomyces albidus (ex Kaewkla and Franco 2022)]|uniref:serine/threonine-protein kinase n=1 Tax=Streptomyces albidus (ex Kaewkla and Franco 2022) TaxID=722709 RepID=UPI0015EF97FC|nr:serine/threonine-protein kinase [Streptomyces albidus (ex Kaewkla and Franco 2022)]
MQPLEPDDPRTIGPYRLLRRIGVGGMGRVYLARSASGRTVAVKVVHPHFCTDEQFRERFRREVASARRVGTAPEGPPGASGWTAPVLDADPDARTPWVATGYVAGPSLQQAVTEHGPLPENSVRVLGAGLAAALGRVHGLGLVHRDVKPSNVMLTPDGPRLIDFGIARATDGTASLTSTGVSIGSPGYMSPEQVLGKGVSHPSDVFSLGAVLAFAARGEAPFPGDSSAALLYKVVHEEPELEGIEGGLRELVAACLAKDAERRPDPAQLAEQLKAAGAVQGSWLPGPIVEQAGRRAVELLDLEPDEGPSGPGGPESGPVPFTTSSHGPREVHGPLGVFGPPDAPFNGNGSAASDWPGTPDRSGFAGQGGLDAKSGQIVPGGQVTPDGHAGTGGRPGLAVTARAERSKRQISCTLVLTAACVLAVGLFSSFFFDILPGSGGDAGNDAAQPPGASASAGSSPPGDQPGGGGKNGGKDGGGKEKSDVPDGFLGTWKGELALDGGTPAGTMRITFEQGEVGEDVGYGGARLLGVSCEGDYTLDSAARSTLKMTSIAPEGSPACADGERVQFTLRGDGTLSYSSRGAGSGETKATLRKVK